jgi:hypothetical protein
MASRVKCKYCNEVFDRDKNAFIKVGSRYAHKECTPKEGSLEEYKRLTDLIKEIFTPSPSNWALIGKQIKGFVAKGLTYVEIHDALFYFYKIKKQQPEKAKGIGIVPFVEKDAQRYFQTARDNYTLKRKIENSDYIKKTETIDEVVVIKKPREKNILDIDY